ncbi:MAG: hypothetical protein IPJ78_19170 [Gemmatimonadetes bacterium]|nr:hypothetical protein [Gemmatimonadota bacterium]
MSPPIPARRVPAIWMPILGVLVGLLLLGRAWSIDRDLGRMPMRVSSLPLLERPFDTSLVMPRSGRFQLVHDFAIPPGNVRGPLREGGPFLEFDGTIGGRRWSTTEPGSTGDYASSGASAGFILGTMEAKRGDTLRLTVRALPTLAAWATYSPRLELRRDHLETMYAPLWRDLGVLAGLVLIALSVWRVRRRPGVD